MTSAAPAPAAPATAAPLEPPPPFQRIADMIREHARARPASFALAQDDRRITYLQLDAMMDRVAATLQRDKVKTKQAVAICALSSPEYAAVYLGALRAGSVAAPLAPSSTTEQLRAMVADSGASLVFLDASTAPTLGDAPIPVGGRKGAPAVRRIALDGDARVGLPLRDWLMPEGSTPKPVHPKPDWPFNIIYSSGTTGVPKGIVQPHSQRWGHVMRAQNYGYGPDGVTLLSTPLYSNTTLVVFFPTLARGGCVVLMAKFDAHKWLQLAQQHKVTHTMLVPVQYHRILSRPDFDTYDLSSFKFKFCTSAPFDPDLKKQAIERWPGGLVEFYGMTEGGGSFILNAHLYPHKLHTVGLPSPGHDIRLLGEGDREVGPGEAGEVVGRSGAMMLGYHNQPGKTEEALWRDAQGNVFIRTGDIGRLDEDGFLILFDRKKDMIISGGFNVYPSDLEAVLKRHPAVADAAVVGVPSTEWGETPVAFVVLAEGSAGTADAEPEAIRAWANAQLGKTQRLSAIQVLESLPRSAIGKILKRELRDDWVARAR